MSSTCHAKQIATANDRRCTDSVFGIRVINCLVSSVLLTEKMQSHDAAGRASNDRVVTGVMIQKLCLKLPLVGMQCYIWTLSGLRENLIIILTFLFRAAASEMWKLNKLVALEREQNTRKVMYCSK